VGEAQQKSLNIIKKYRRFVPICFEKNHFVFDRKTLFKKTVVPGTTLTDPDIVVEHDFDNGAGERPAEAEPVDGFTSGTDSDYENDEGR